MQEYSSDIKKTTMLLMVLTIITKLLGFSRELIISSFFGASRISDAYLISLSIPGSLFVIIGTGITTGFIPMYSHIEKSRDGRTADEFMNSLMNSIVIITFFMILIVYAFPKGIVKLFAYGFDSSTMSLAVGFSRISVLGISCTGLAYVITGYLNVKYKFLIPVLMSIPFNLCIIASCFLGYYGSITLLPLGNALADMLQLLLLIPFAYQLGFRYHLMLDLKNPYLRKTLKLSIPIMIGTSINQINVMTGKTIASLVVEGGISALNYANRLNMVIQGVFITTVVTVLFPAMSKLAAEEDHQGLGLVMVKAIHLINLFVLPASIGCMILAEPIISLLFGRGAFDSEAVKLTSEALFYYSVGMPAFGLREILSRAFYAVQDTRTPMINAGIGMAGNILLSFLLSRMIGLGGLAAATSIIAILSAGMLYITLKKRLGAFLKAKEFGLTSLKIIGATLSMGLAVKLIYQFLNARAGMKLAMAVAVAVGVFLYGLLLILMKVEYATSLMNIMKSRLWNLIHRLPVYKEAGHSPVCTGNMDKEKSFQNPSFERDVIKEKSNIRAISGWKNGRGIGIVILTSEHLTGLSLTLKYLLNQTWKGYQLYIIDFGEQEETGTLIRQLQNQHNNISYLKLQPQLGSAGAYYYGMKLAYDKGMGYLWILTDQDLPHPNALSVLITMMAKVGPGACLISRLTEQLDRNSLVTIINSENLLHPMDQFGVSGLFLPISLIEDIGLPKKELITYFEASEYSERAVSFGYHIYQVRDSFLLHKKTPEGVKSINLFGRRYLLHKRTGSQWYYYMRNAVATKPKSNPANRAFRKQLLLELVKMLIIDTPCFPAAFAGYCHGIRGKSGKHKKY